MDEEQRSDYDQIDIDQLGDVYDAPQLGSLPSNYSDTSGPVLKFTYSGISNNSSAADYLMQSRLSEEGPGNLQFLEPTDLFSSIEQIVSDIRSSLLLEDDLILYLLFTFRWSSEKLMDDYYDTLTVPYNYKNQRIINPRCPNHVYADCPICCTQKMLYCNALCDHYYCEGCWSDYIGECLGEGTAFFSCMNNCKDAPILLNNFIRNRFPNYYTQYTTNICRNYCQWSKTITYCPSRMKKCDLFCSKAPTASINIVECLCGEQYCFHCRKDPHQPATCEDVTRWEQLLNKEEDNINWIKKNTKACPKCHNPVEKAIGCSMIKCICGTQFCYNCCGLWDEQHRGNMGECVKLARKASLKGQTTSAVFLALQQTIQTQTQRQKYHQGIFHSVLAGLEGESLKRELIDLSKEVKEAWVSWKWGTIVLFIYQKAPIDEQIDIQYRKSIHKLVQPLIKVSKVEEHKQLYELLRVKDELMNKKGTMNNFQKVWMEAWRSR